MAVFAYSIFVYIAFYILQFLQILKSIDSHSQIRNLSPRKCASHVQVMFRRMDIDESGEVLLDELLDGFVQMKQATKGMERVLTFISQTSRRERSRSKKIPKRS